jgi:uncharacterized protein (DUF302 family)
MANQTTTAYANQVYLPVSYTETLDRVVAALKEEGFGVLSEIDMQATLKQKRNVDVGRYVILGVCHPPFAERALQTDRNAGLLLPCNVVVYEQSEGSVVAILDPMKAISIADNSALDIIAEEANQKLSRVLAALK